MTRTRSLVGLGVWAALCFGTGAAGSIFTAGATGDWYVTLAKPPWTPPGWLFGPVWAALYLMMAVAAWLVWRKGGVVSIGGLGLFVLQLGLNLAWPVLFFGFRLPGVAFGELCALLGGGPADAPRFLESGVAGGPAARALPGVDDLRGCAEPGHLVDEHSNVSGGPILTIGPPLVLRHYFWLCAVGLLTHRATIPDSRSLARGCAAGQETRRAEWCCTASLRKGEGAATSSLGLPR